jgi:hypothetical protein
VRATGKLEGLGRVSAGRAEIIRQCGPRGGVLLICAICLIVFAGLFVLANIYHAEVAAACAFLGFLLTIFVPLLLVTWAILVAILRNPVGAFFLAIVVDIVIAKFIT